MVTKQEVYELLQKNSDVAVRLMQPAELTIEEFVDSITALIQSYQEMQKNDAQEEHLQMTVPTLALCIKVVASELLKVQESPGVLNDNIYYVCNKTRDLFKWNPEERKFCRVLSTDIFTEYAYDMETKKLHKIYQVQECCFLRVTEKAFVFHY